MDAGRHNVPLSCDSNAVVDVMFDSHLSTPAVPDHLITAIIKSLYHCCFNAIRCDKDRSNSEMRILNGIKSNGVGGEGNILIFNRDLTYDGLPRLKMTTLILTLLFAPPLFSEVNPQVNTCSFFTLPALLQDVVRRLDFLPSYSQPHVFGNECSSTQKITTAATRFLKSGYS